MMKITNKTIVLLTFLITSCNTLVEPEISEETIHEVILNEEVIEQKEERVEEEDYDYIAAVIAKPVNWSTNGLDFSYSNFTISIDEMGIDYEHANLVPSQNDSCIYNLGMAEHINDVNIRISTTLEDGYTKFQVYQRSRINFSISNEGPHCDLDKLDPYYTEWMELVIKEPNISFQTPDRDKIQMPEIQMSDTVFKALVLEHCGDRYASLLNSKYNSSCNSHLSTSGYEIKVLASQRNGNVQTAYIFLSSLMGC